ARAQAGRARDGGGGGGRGPGGLQRHGRRAEDHRPVPPGDRQGGHGGLERAGGQVRGRAVQQGHAGGRRGAGGVEGGDHRRRRRDGRGGRGGRPGRPDDTRPHRRRPLPGRPP